MRDGAMHSDVVDDLVGYTGLERGKVVALIRRKHEDFRTEWHAFPPQLRDEAWFYLASRTYLFANATHDANQLVESLCALLPDSGEILDFGGGTGNLALALAGKGYRVDYLERSALQKDFVRYRLDKHGLSGRVRIIDQWTPLEPDAYDMVCAMDVFEHVEALSETLDSVLRAIHPSGVLVENSPFVRNVENPMHHDDRAAFPGLMRSAGFDCISQSDDLTVWRR
jgi:SAM-dependent methyltransferase